MKKIAKAGRGLMVLVLAAGLTACQSNESNNTAPNAANNTAATESEGTLDYTYGLNTQFHSDTPVTYSMMYNDHPNYPYKKDWLLWSALEQRTNVQFNLSVTALSEYENQKALLINSGDAPYIIPKTYDDSAFVAGGQIVPISDWVQYMPNYMDTVKNWHMEDDLKAKMKADGKYYSLPGMWENSGGGYSFVIRRDIFKAAGVDLTNEGKWTYDDFYDALKKVKDFTGAPYVISDQYTGKSILSLVATQFGATAGWGMGTGVRFDEDKKQFYFADNTNDFKDFVTYLNKLVDEGLVDPESFTQDGEVANNKFYKGDTYAISGNYQFLADAGQKMQVKDADLYMIVQPGGPKGKLRVENSRLENGVMISQNALDELGKDKFIKMLRFIDWLWYSDEGHTFAAWGEEGETYTKDTSGNFVLNKDISYNGINADTATKQLNADFGFANGVFSYGGSAKLRFSRMTEGEKDFWKRIEENTVQQKLAPPIMASSDEAEELNLISKPLVDYINTMTLKFITGQEDIETSWDNYVAQVKEMGADRYVDSVNEIFDRTKDVLGY